MNGGGGGGRLRRRKSLHERLGLKSMVCCGSTWSFGIGTSAMSAQADNDDEIEIVIENENENENDVVESNQQIDVIDVNMTILTPPDTNSGPDCTFPSPRMNLADALAAERQFRSTAVTGDDLTAVTEEGTPLRISLMRLLEETETEMQTETERGTDGQDESMGRDQMCCVCMGRKKDAAFIPCGHTFCRVCCRELWLNRGSCPLCNRSILEILDIY